MITHKQQRIETALSGIEGVSKVLTRKEIRELPSILWEDELPEAIITGLYHNHNGILMATNKRAIFIDKGLFSLRVEDFAYDKISSIEYRTGMMMGEVDIYASGNKAEIKSVPNNQVRPSAEHLRARISPQIPHQNMPKSSSNDADMISKLERLANLKAQGVLTDEEFEREKKRILGA